MIKKEPNILDELKNLSREKLSHSEFRQHVIDYYLDAPGYDIDEDSDYYYAIELAYGDIDHAYNHYKLLF